MRGELFSPLEVLNDLFAELLTMQTRPHKATVIARCLMQAFQISIFNRNLFVIQKLTQRGFFSSSIEKHKNAISVVASKNWFARLSKLTITRLPKTQFLKLVPHAALFVTLSTANKNCDPIDSAGGAVAP